MIYMKKKSYLSKQKGMTLVGVMIGMLIGLLVSLSVMGLYRETLVAATASSQASLRMAKLNSGLISSTNTMQKAGYFIDPINADIIKNNLVILSGAKLSNEGLLSGTIQTTPTELGQTATGNALVWGWKDEMSGPVNCAALLISDKDLIALTTNSCSTPNNISTITWKKINLISNTLDAQSSMVASFTNCAIYSYGNKVNAPSLELKLVFKPTDVSESNSSMNGNVCFHNFKR